MDTRRPRDLTGTGGVARDETVGDDEPPGSTAPGVSHPRLVSAAVCLVAILPIWVAALRAGIRGIFPYSDAATTVLRARGVFSGPFPLVGMPAAAATSGGFQSYFPAAWQLYLLAVPTRVFGNVWGPLLAMAALNTLWVVLVCRLLFRRLPTHEALLGVGFFVALLWSLGSGFLITPVPMDMVVIPTAVLLFFAWAVAHGDHVAVPVFAFVANFLFLDHLVLVLTVPVVVVAAALGFWLSARRARRDDPEGEPTRRRAIIRSLVGAGVITGVMWIPPVVQQITASPGNLRVLFSSAGVDRPTIGSWATALHDVIAVIARPPFWFREAFHPPPYLHRTLGAEVVGALSVYDLVIVAVLVAAFVGLGSLSRRRGDRSSVTLLAIAAVAIAAAAATAYSAPTYYGPPTGYLRSLWPTAMFVWFTLVLVGVRALPDGVARRAWMPAGAAIVVLAALNLPMAPHAYGADRRTNDLVTMVNDTVIDHVADGGTVMLNAGIDFASHDFGSALELALNGAGVDYCIPERERRRGDSRPACPDRVDRIIDLRVTASPPADPGGTVLVRANLLDHADLAELAALETSIDTWLASGRSIEISEQVLARAEAMLDSDGRMQLEELLEPGGRDPGRIRADPLFRGLVQFAYGSVSSPDAALFPDAPLTAAQWRRWLELSTENRTLLVAEHLPDD